MEVGDDEMFRTAAEKIYIENLITGWKLNIYSR